MEFGVLAMTLLTYAVACYAGLRARTTEFVIGLLVAHPTALLALLWQPLFRFNYSAQYTAVAKLKLPWLAEGAALPFIIFVSAWALTAPAVVAFALFRARRWPLAYPVVMLLFAMFTCYFILIEQVCVRSGWWTYSTDITLPFKLPPFLLTSVMQALIALGSLTALFYTRRNPWRSRMISLLPVPIGLSIVVYGLLGAPFYTTMLFGMESWAVTIGFITTSGLVLAGAHTIGRVLAQEQDWRAPTDRRWS